MVNQVKMVTYKEPWWRDYRIKKYKPKTNLSSEMIFRKSIKDTTMEYLRNASLAGIPKIIAPETNHFQRLVRIALFVVMSMSTWYYLSYVWYGLLTNPLVVSTESATYSIDQIDFPAVALCNSNRISKKAMKEYAKKLQPIIAKNNESIEEVEWFIKQMGRLIDFSMDYSLQNHPFLDITVKNSNAVEERMRMMAPKCEEMLLACTWLAVDVDCMSIFDVRRTVHGHCCVFNYVLELNSGYRKPNGSISDIKRQAIAGAGYGLTVIMDFLLDDYTYALGGMTGVEVILFDPTHFPETKSGGRVIQGIIQPNEVALFELKSTKQIAASEVRKHSLATRKCLFHDEYASVYGDMYSYSACLMKCRMRVIQSLCKCTPYFYPVTQEDGHICTLDNLQCLNKFREKFMYLYPFDAENEEGLEIEVQDSLYCPECYPDCEFTKHYSRSSKIPFIDMESGKFLQTDMLDFENLSHKCVLFVHQSTSDGILDRLDVVSYWFEIVSNVGGFSSILLGISQISIVEVFFFFTIRFIYLIVQNFRKYY